MLGVHVLSHDLSSEIFINETLKFLAVFGISQACTCIWYLISAMCWPVLLFISLSKSCLYCNVQPFVRDNKFYNLVFLLILNYRTYLIWGRDSFIFVCYRFACCSLFPNEHKRWRILVKEFLLQFLNHCSGLVMVFVGDIPPNVIKLCSIAFKLKINNVISKKCCIFYKSYLACLL